jgi:hypothetical protein
MLNCKGFRRKRLWPNFRYCPICLQGLKEITKNLGKDGRSPSWYLKTVPLDYEAGMLWHSVSVVWILSARVRLPTAVAMLSSSSHVDESEVYLASVSVDTGGWFKEVIDAGARFRLATSISLECAELDLHCPSWKLFFFEGGVGLVPKRGCLLTIAYYAFPRWYEFGERRWNDILTGENWRTRRKTYPSATLSTTNPTWNDPGANPGLRGQRPATNNLNHGTAFMET